MLDYERYQYEVMKDIGDCLNEMGTQPILFVGSGLSQRYFGSPNWLGLLEELQKRCPIAPHEVAFYIQDGMAYEDIGTELSNYYQKWAWQNRDQFDPELFKPIYPKDIYIKSQLADLFRSITPGEPFCLTNDDYNQELESLIKIQPHAIVTTNYDTFLETVFPEYQPIIGQQVLRPDAMSIGEIFKIHGCVSHPAELVFHREDYNSFLNRKNI